MLKKAHETLDIIWRDIEVVTAVGGVVLVLFGTFRILIG